MKLHNFNPGPGILPDIALQRTAEAVIDLDGSGLSLMEISHRGDAFESILHDTETLLRALLDIPDGYKVLFLGGGASTQFVVVPYNLLRTKAAFVETDAWAQKAMAEADHFGATEIIASSADKNFSYIPKHFTIPTDVDYLHITTNNTLYGTQFHDEIDSPVPLVADMSSDILSKPIDVSKYALIYGGVQKNMGPAGAGFVIVREDVLGHVDRKIPTMIDYRTHIQHNSLYNTPPVTTIYTIREVLRWLSNLGGLKEIETRNHAKSALLYDEIDRNPCFRGTAAVEDRSHMNACFVMTDGYKDLEQAFLARATDAGVIGIKGHRAVGGFRASMYNALPIESVEVLVYCMQRFAEEHAS